MLMVADHLDHVVGGPSVAIEGQSVPPRRTLYAHIDRQNLPSLFRTFDFANPDTHNPGRYETTVPQQGLFLMNHPSTLQLARRVVRAIDRDLGGPRDDRSFIDALFGRVLGHTPTPAQRDRVAAFLNTPTRTVAPPTSPSRLWSYGVSRIDASGRPIDFAPLTHFESDTYRPTATFPAEPPLGHASIHRHGGHPPADPSMAVVRRFTVPFDGTAKVRFQFDHASQKGDGVTLDVWVGDRNVRKIHRLGSRLPFSSGDVPVSAGDVIDFVVHSGPTDAFDAFKLATTLTIRGLNAPDGGSGGGEVIDTQSVKDYAPPPGPMPPPMSRREMAAQALLLSNEFLFVD